MYFFFVHMTSIKFNKIKNLKLEFIFSNNKLIIVREVILTIKLDLLVLEFVFNIWQQQ